MENACEIYALRYATMSPRTPHMNFVTPDPHEAAASDLDYFVWLVRGGGRDIQVRLCLFGCDMKTTGAPESRREWEMPNRPWQLAPQFRVREFENLN